MSQAAKPADIKFLMKPASTACNDVKGFKNKDANLNNHVQAVADGFNIFVWFATVIFVIYLLA